MRTATIAATAALALMTISGVAAGLPTMKQTDSTARKKVHVAKRKETQADLLKAAKITMDSARTIALAKVPGATVQSEEIERENGRLIYSFDLKTAGATGIDEVNVNALTGKIVGKVQHESPKTESKEAKIEAKEAKKK